MAADLALKGQVEILHQQAAASEKEFCIDLEGEAPDGRSVWEWMGYSRKDAATRSLCKLIEGVDYQSTEVWTVAGGTPRLAVLFSRDGFKQWGMLAGTDRGRQIRLYFIECEKRLQLGMAQPTALNGTLERILERQQALAEDMSSMMLHGFDTVHSRIDSVESRLSRLEEQQCDQLYVVVRSSDLTIKLGYTQDLEERRKKHERRGFRLLGCITGTHKRETEIKKSLASKGFKPKNGTEEYHLTPEIVEAFAQEGLPIGDLCATKPKNGIPRRPTARCEASTLPLLQGC